MWASSCVPQMASVISVFVSEQGFKLWQCQYPCLSLVLCLRLSLSMYMHACVCVHVDMTYAYTDEEIERVWGEGGSGARVHLICKGLFISSFKWR